MDQDAAVESEDGDQDTCSFSKSEAELLGTFTSSSMTREDGDRLMQWASNKCFKGEDVQPVKICTLIDSVAKKYAPEGVKRADFTEEMDGDQRIVFYYRDLFTCVINLLQHPRFKARQYTKFRLVRDVQGHRVYGAFNTGDWYRVAQITAGNSAPDKRVSPVPVFLSSDATYAKKSVGVWPIYCWCPFPHFFVFFKQRQFRLTSFSQVHSAVSTMT